jgi:hypothetical protein
MLIELVKAYEEKVIIKGNEMIAVFMDGEHPLASITHKAHHNYHTSWDWLMPVVAKCYDEGAESDEIGDITMYLTDIDIQRTYESVVKFIKTNQR